MFFFPPWGMILGTMAGAFVAELFFSGKSTEDSLHSALGAFLGFLSGTGIKLAATGVMLFYIIACVLSTLSMLARVAEPRKKDEEKVKKAD